MSPGRIRCAGHRYEVALHRRLPAHMIRFTGAVRHRGTQQLQLAVKRDIEAMDPALLPLQQGLVHGSYAVTDDLQAVILRVDEVDGSIRCRAGIFYAGIIAGSCCADDPTTVDKTAEYCQIDITIDIATAVATIALVAEEDG